MKHRQSRLSRKQNLKAESETERRNGSGEYGGHHGRPDRRDPGTCGGDQDGNRRGCQILKRRARRQQKQRSSQKKSWIRSWKRQQSRIPYDEESGLTLGEVMEQAVEQEVNLLALDAGETVSFMAVNTAARSTQSVNVTRGSAYYLRGLWAWFLCDL